MAARKTSWVMEFVDKATPQIKKLDKSIDKSTKGVAGLDKKLKNLGKENGLYKTGSELMSIAGQMKAVGVAAGAFAGLAIKANTDYNRALSETQANLQATGAEMEKLDKHIRSMDRRGSRTSMMEMSSVYASAGFSNEQIQGMLEPSDVLTSMGVSESITADIVATGVLQYDISPDEGMKIADMMAKGRALAKQDIDDIGALASSFSGTARQMNMDLEDVTTMSAILADANMRGSEAGTSLNAVYRDLIGSMEDGAIQIGETAISVVNADGSMRTMQDILMDITDTTANFTDEQRAMALANVFGANSMKAVNAFIGQGSDKYKEYEQAIMGADGAAKEMSDTLNDNLAGDMALFKSLSSDVMGDIGVGISSIARIVIKGATSVMKVINALPQGVKSGIGVIVGGIAALITGMATLGAVMKGAGIIKTLVGFVGIGGKVASMATGLLGAIKGIGAFFVANPIVLGIMATVAAGVLLYRNWDTIKAKAGQFKEYVSTKWAELTTAVTDFVTQIKTNVSTKWNELTTGIVTKMQEIKTNVTTKWTEIVEGVKSRITGFMEFMSGLPSRLFEIGRDMVSSFAESVKDFGSGIGGKITGFFGFGGKKGKSHRTGKNKVPYDGYQATLHKDEMVLQKSVADKFRNLGGTERTLPKSKSSQPTVNIPDINVVIENVNSSRDAKRQGKIAGEQIRKEIDTYFRDMGFVF